MNLNFKICQVFHILLIMLEDTNWTLANQEKDKAYR